MFIVLIILIVGIFLDFNKESYAISSNIDPSTWYYVDGLGRSSTNDVTKSKKVRLVGMFYWTWHLDLNSPGPFNLNNIIEESPNAKNDYNNSVWKKYNAGANGTGYYWWDEPLLGYYRENDDSLVHSSSNTINFFSLSDIIKEYLVSNGFMNAFKEEFEAFRVVKLVYYMGFSDSDEYYLKAKDELQKISFENNYLIPKKDIDKAKLVLNSETLKEASLAIQLYDCRRKVDTLENSKSWKITKPIRKFTSSLK